MANTKKISKHILHIILWRFRRTFSVISEIGNVLP
jgi:hypothetical protein